MAEFPPAPLSPAEFLEEWFPEAFAAAGAPAGAEDIAVRLGIALEGEGGGEWIFHLESGQLRVEPGSRENAAFTYVQSVEDWRGALWEGRGGAIGEGSALFFKPGAARLSAPGQLGGTPPPSALKEMEKLSGVIRMVVRDAEGEEWSVAFKLGPGEIPEEPTTTLVISAEDAAAMQRGELDPMTAFMSGRLQVMGDMTLMMQMQAIQMQAQAQAAAQASAAAKEEAGS